MKRLLTVVLFIAVILTGCSKENKYKTDKADSATEESNVLVFYDIESDFNSITDLYVKTLEARDVGDFGQLNKLNKTITKEINKAYDNLYKYERNDLFEDINSYYRLLVQYNQYINTLDSSENEQDYLSEDIIIKMHNISMKYNKNTMPVSFTEFLENAEKNSSIKKSETLNDYKEYKIVDSSEEEVNNENKTSVIAPATNKINKEQKELLVSFVQQSLSDYDYKYKYQGYDVWDVVTNDETELKRYIITTNDSKLGRIKSIIEWDGNINSKKEYNANLLYLLVGGEELVNKL